MEPVMAMRTQATYLLPLRGAAPREHSLAMATTALSEVDFIDLRATYVNCTLKRSPELSHTQGLVARSAAIMRKHGVDVHEIRAVDHDIATGVYLDMTEHGWDRDEWPTLFTGIVESDIVVIAGPIWLGDNASVTKRVIERLYAASSMTNASGQHVYYGWIGEAGPGPSYLDPGSGGPENEFTQRNTTFMTWNLMHLAAMLKRAGGFPVGGNQRTEWDAGARFDYENPEYR